MQSSIILSLEMAKSQHLLRYVAEMISKKLNKFLEIKI